MSIQTYSRACYICSWISSHATWGSVIGPTWRVCWHSTLFRQIIHTKYCFIIRVKGCSFRLGLTDANLEKCKFHCVDQNPTRFHNESTAYIKCNITKKYIFAQLYKFQVIKCEGHVLMKGSVLVSSVHILYSVSMQLIPLPDPCLVYINKHEIKHKNQKELKKKRRFQWQSWCK